MSALDLKQFEPSAQDNWQKKIRK